MSKIRNMQEYWKSLPKIDRCGLMTSLYINPEIGNLEFHAIPSHIRTMLYAQWNSKWKDLNHELNF